MAGWMKAQKAAATHTLMDAEGTVGRAYGARTTPHMYVINPAGTLVYAGAIDSKPSANPADIPTATNHVKQALAEIAGRQAGHRGQHARLRLHGQVRRRPPERALRLRVVHRQTGHVHARHQHAAGPGLGGEFVSRPLLARGSDEQGALVVAAEAGHGGAAHRQAAPSAEQLAIGRQAQQPLAFEHRHPVGAFGVDRGSIGAATVAVEPAVGGLGIERSAQNTAPAQAAVVAVEVDGVDAVRRGVAPVQRARRRGSRPGRC
jgi:hypothetical protein